MATTISWQWTRFEGLSLQALYEMLALRQKVFVLEQGPYLDADGLDQHSWHLLGRVSGAPGAGPGGAPPEGIQAPRSGPPPLENGELLLYLRVVDPGLKYDEPSIGRVVIDKTLRGTGLGRVMMAEAMKRCGEAWPGRANRISAQAHLSKFYGEFGFVPVGEPYLEDNIPHLQMLRQP
jgi:ElaA protein